LSVHPEKQIDTFERLVYFIEKILEVFVSLYILTYRSTKPVLPQTLDEDDHLRTEYLLRKCHDYFQVRGCRYFRRLNSVQ